jgi:hypothetical protein
MSHRNRLLNLVWVGALVLTAVVYLPTLLYGDFLQDDYGLGLFIEDGAVSWSKAFSYFFPSHLTRDQFLRPIPVLVGVLDLAVWGANPFGFHLTNLLIHLVGALLLGALAARLTSNRWVGPLTTLAYGLYPGHAESVAWIIHRMVGLVVVFYVATLLLHLTPKLRPLAWLTALIALLCKEPAANLPAVVFLLHFYLERTGPVRDRVLRAVRHALPYVGVLVIYAVWKGLAFGGLVTGYGKYATYFDYFLGEKIYLDLPMSAVRFLSPVNGELVGAIVIWLHVMLAVVGLGLLVVHADWRSNTRIPFVFGIALAVLSLLIVVPFLSVPAGLTNSRHFTPPAMGLAMAIGALMAAAPRRGRIAVGIWFLLYALPIVLNLVPYSRAGRVARAVRTGVVQLVADYPPNSAILVARTPGAVSGAPVFGDGSSLKGALRPPFASSPVSEVHTTLDDPPGDPDSVLLTLRGPIAVLEVNGEASSGEREVVEVTGPVSSRSYPAPLAVELISPRPDAEVVLTDDPAFVFRSTEDFPYYRIVFKAGDAVVPLLVERPRHLESEPSGRLVYHPSAGDAHGRRILDGPEVRRVRGPVTWYVEGVRDPSRPRSALARSEVGRFRVTGAE